MGACKICGGQTKWSDRRQGEYCPVCDKVSGRPTSKTVKLPCQIGDEVWFVKSYKGNYVPKRGIVSEMRFTNDMDLIITVKSLGRGKWNERVFATRIEAFAGAIQLGQE